MASPSIPPRRSSLKHSKQNLKYSRSKESAAPRSQPSMDDDSDNYSILSDILSAYEPPLSHLASNPSLRSHSTRQRHRLLTPITEQRHPGKEGVRLSKYTREWQPKLSEEGEKPHLQRLQPHGESVEAAAEASAVNNDDEGFVHGLSLALLIMGLCLVVFLISIDRTSITTAIPFITAEFHSTSDIGWYGSSYLLTVCAFQPIFGRIFTLFSIKWSYMLSMFMFMLGSLVCGVAPNSVALIIGRSIAGFGSAGILAGSFVIVAIAVPLSLRPIYTAVVGLMFGVGSTVGPLMGGVFTDLVTWRWCFWLNLPAGAITVVVMLLVFHPPPHAHHKRTFIDRFADLDIIGNVILLGSAIMLFLALEMTTVGEDWGSARIIGLLCGCGGSALLFVVWQWWKADGALIPPVIVTQPTVGASCLMAFFTYGALLVHTYFLPIWFQAVWGDSAIQSGVLMIPYFAANVLFSLFSGIFVSKVGYFAPVAIVGSAIGAVGCGILTLLNPNSSTGMWAGFEILSSAGFGISIQQSFTAVQTVLPKEDVAVGTASVVASQSLGGAIFISVGNSVFQSRLSALVGEEPIPGVDIRQIIAAGATAFRTLVPKEQLPALIQEYSRALQTVMTVAVPLGGLACISCCFLEWKSVIGKGEGQRKMREMEQTPS
ncbi:hypothetical protein JX265_011371 [Neoarthrinium moseri]|uniref:Major facilitator superfamily (MFS) profile domain-containing protein n=1 Tax=Neoarthrinium moseri TaxID=1658444 RepID=A0A9Q0AHQ0_9PEZI|nr:hypothetical protein JX265_011371 [Neoarthrinium moseri]